MASLLAGTAGFMFGSAAPAVRECGYGTGAKKRVPRHLYSIKRVVHQDGRVELVRWRRT